ncbi:uncharacterized protein [Haliotis asinina]|uniref:uncharacterized protein isoform X2 n=1 Tax=Haliotis asinina TaxID=109174 RepID=UPI0035318E1D
MECTSRMEAWLCCVITALVLKAGTAATIVATVACNGSSIEKQFFQVYSRSILYKGSQIVYMGKNGTLSLVPDSAVNVEHFYKTDDNIITATIRVNCSDVTEIQCEMFGMRRNQRDTGFLNIQFSPETAFNVENKTSVRRDPTYDVHQVFSSVTVYCQAVVGSKAPVWHWEMKNSTQELHWFTITEGVIESQPRLTSCAYHTSSQLTYIPIVEGIFSFHLFLTSILFVYIPFIVTPLVWTCFPNGLKKIRQPENTKMRILRSCASFLWSIAFIVFWIYLCYNNGSHPLTNGYGSFAAMEGSVLFIYAVLRSVVVYIRKPEKRHLYNARVALSYGAVLCPCMCWPILKMLSETQMSITEIVFWLIAAPSLVLSIYVSHDREGKDWEKED